MAEFIYRLDIRGHYLNQLTVNTFYWRCLRHNNVVNPMADIAGYFNQSPGPMGFWSQMLCDNAFIDFLRISRISPNPALREGETFDPSHHHGVAGLGGGSSQFALVLNRRALNASRSFNGRVYVPGVAMSAYIGGLLNPLSLQAVSAANFCAFLLDGWQGQAIRGEIPNFYEMGLIRRRPPFPNRDDYHFRPLATFTPASAPRYLYSRRVGVGR
jgi:hypothetical protein